MRYRRAILFSEEGLIHFSLKRYFEDRGYETLVFHEPIVCPVYDADREMSCGDRICCDVMLVVDGPPQFDSIELFQEQVRHGCMLPALNRAVISWSPLSRERLQTLETLGAVIFPHPFELGMLGPWLEGCETRIGTDTPLVLKRKEPRRLSGMHIRFHSASRDEHGHAKAVNISACGICLKMPKAPKVREQLRLHGGDAPFSEEAVVRWVRQDDDGSYTAGMVFCV
ncbi:MAG: PilZ domain-containing protein [Nitrospiraceae bacterium]|nr:PilZ domain-containing protein [Nitrospiraceae bacterium]